MEPDKPLGIIGGGIIVWFDMGRWLGILLLLAFVHHKVGIINRLWRRGAGFSWRSWKQRDQHPGNFMHGWPLGWMALCAQKSKLEGFPDVS